MTGCPFHQSQTTDIGTTYNPLSPEQTRDPYGMYRQARETQPVFFSELYQMWIVTRYDDVVKVLKDTDTYSSLGIITVNSGRLPAEVVEVLEQGYPQVPGMTDNDPPHHDRIRSLVGKAFSQRIVTAMEPHIRFIANEVADQFVAQGEIDILEHYAFPFPLIVIADVLGVDRDHLASLKQWSDDWVALLAAPLSLEEQLENARGFVAFQHFYHDLIEEKRLNPKQDLISHMIHARQEGMEPLTTLEMVNVCMSATWAGHQTVTSMICNLLYRLLAAPGLWQACCRDRSLIPTVREEVLRIDSPLQSMMRYTIRDTELGGVTIPEGAPVQVLFGAGNHDDRIFADPESFMPGREDVAKHHLAFGKGIHYCLGSQLARLEGQVAVEVLMDRCPDLHLMADQVIEYQPNFLYRTMKSLQLVWTPPASGKRSSNVAQTATSEIL